MFMRRRYIVKSSSEQLTSEHERWVSCPAPQGT